MRCLVADRSATSRAMMTHVLRRAAATDIVSACSLEEALAACETGFELVVIDRDLSSSQGWEWLAELRDEACAEGRLIVIGTRVSRTEVESLRALGCGAFLLKPLDPGVLAERVTMLMSADSTPESGETGDASEPLAEAA